MFRQHLIWDLSLGVREDSLEEVTPGPEECLRVKRSWEARRVVLMQKQMLTMYKRCIQAEGKLVCLELKGLLGHYDAGEMG